MGSEKRDGLGSCSTFGVDFLLQFIGFLYVAGGGVGCTCLSAWVGVRGPLAGVSSLSSLCVSQVAQHGSQCLYLSIFLTQA